MRKSSIFRFAIAAGLAFSPLSWAQPPTGSTGAQPSVGLADGACQGSSCYGYVNSQSHKFYTLDSTVNSSIQSLLAALNAPLTMPGTSATSAVTVQGNASGVPIPVTVTNGSTGSNFNAAFPSSGTAFGLSDGTNMRALAGINYSGSLYAAAVALQTPVPAGANVIGGINISQTTPGTTNGVVVNSSALPSGAATSGNQTTANTSLSTLVTNTTGLATSTLQGTGNTSLASLLAVTGTTADAAYTGSGSATLNSILKGIYANGGGGGPGGTVNQGTAGASAWLFALPSGASTSSLQTSGNASLTTIATNSGNAATSALQGTGNTTLSSILALTPALNGDGGAQVHVQNFPATQPISAASLPLPTGAATSANQATQITAEQTTATNSATQATAANQVTGNSSASTTATNTGTIATNTGAVSTVAGTTADTPYAGSGSSTLSATERGIYAKLGSVGITSGSSLIGKVGVDQTTIGTTNGISIADIGATAASTGAGVATGGGVLRVAAAQDTTTLAGSAPGTAGTASTNVISIQGIASMTPILSNPGTPASWGIGSIGSAAPGNGILIAGSDGTASRALLASSSGHLVIDCNSVGGSCGGSGSTGSNFGAAFPTAGLAIGVTDGTDMRAVTGINYSGSNYAMAAQVFGALPAGTNQIGHVIADTGSTTVVTSLPALAAGTAIIGKVDIDQTTPGTTNGVVVNSSALPTGASTSANQSTEITDLASIVTNTTSIATAANQSTIITDLGTINTSIGTVNTSIGTLTTDTTRVQAAPGAAAPTTVSVVGGSDGTDARAILTSSSGHIVIDCNSAGGSCASSGGTSSTVGSAVPTTATAAGFSDGTNMRLGTVINYTGSSYAQAVEVFGSLPAGSALMGKVGIDQTTPGTTNGVSITNANSNGQTTMANSSPVVLASDQSTINTAITNANANGQGTMANSSPVVIASNQSAISTTVSNVNSNGQAASSGSSPVVLASDQAVNDACSMFTAKSNKAISTNTGSTQLVAGVSGQKVYVCSIILVVPSAMTVSFTEGTGTNCGTGAAPIIGSTTAASGLSFAANGGLTVGGGGATVGVTATVADEVCILQSGTVQLAGNITYVQR